MSWKANCQWSRAAKKHALLPGGFAYFPNGAFPIAAAKPSRAAVIEKVYNEIDAQIYDFNGQAVGTPFKVNANNLPNTPTDASQVHPQVAISDGTSWSVTDDSIVVTWDAITAKLNGVETDSVVMGRRFAGDGSASTIDPEVQLSVGGVGGTPTTRAAAMPRWAMDPAGDFTVVWESYQDADNSFGVYASRFLADGTPDMVDEQANMVLGNVLFAGSSEPVDRH